MTKTMIGKQHFRNNLFLALALCTVLGCATVKPAEKKDIFEQENLIAWCIVPFDAAGRNAQQRAQMLKDLNFRGYAYDWRTEHIPFLTEEIETMRNNNINIDAIWFWIDGGGGELLDTNNQEILKVIKEQNLQTQLWIGFNERVIDQLPEPERLPQAVKLVGELREEAAKAGCTIALYNHLGWTGEPANQVKIIESLGADDIGIVYNFHHAHEQLDDFEKNLKLMMPYLKTVNLNGMQPEGPKILPLGKGSEELEMMRVLKNSGFQGKIGILGHTDGLDIKPVLEENLEGLRDLVKQL